MILGPVFRAELVRTSRRRQLLPDADSLQPRSVAAPRRCYQSLMARRWQCHDRGYYPVPLISILANFAIETFAWFAGVQLVALLVLVPALCGGVIADEKQRKTIHYLMASRLSSGEIVVDKPLARMLHVLVFVLLGVPVLSRVDAPGRSSLGAHRRSACRDTSVLLLHGDSGDPRLGPGLSGAPGVLISYLLLIFWLIVPAHGRPGLPGPSTQRLRLLVWPDECLDSKLEPCERLDASPVHA